MSWRNVGIFVDTFKLCKSKHFCNLVIWSCVPNRIMFKEPTTPNEIMTHNQIIILYLTESSPQFYKFKWPYLIACNPGLTILWDNYIILLPLSI